MGSISGFGVDAHIIGDLTPTYFASARWGYTIASPLVLLVSLIAAFGSLRDMQIAGAAAATDAASPTPHSSS